MVDVLNDTPSGGPYIELHIWIGHYADGSEGIVAADLPTLSGLVTRHSPLMSSKREVAERVGVLARQVQSASQHSAQGRIVRLELRTFRAVMS